eukprot:scaffold326641_cov18-Prasinocladus_malaysianus.AAC.1
MAAPVVCGLTCRVVPAAAPQRVINVRDDFDAWALVQAGFSALAGLETLRPDVLQYRLAG